ncbi:MAG TPA: alpha/beta hydrolase [Solirubrobacteraceae bacterium]|jgi:pimeloyl-ACP methyl ester carboxylesterase
MRGRVITWVLGVLLPVLSLSGLPASSAASSALSFTPCADNQGFGCTTVSVPVDRSGALPGTIALKVERMQAGGAPSTEAVIALAGGPGQAALPLAGFLAKALAPALSTRDLVMFDQRGTGESGPLSCPALNSLAGAAGISSVGRLFERCALQLGPARGQYTTQTSVEDIEAVRQAMGYEKLVLYGVSYGTKVALEYAARYPQNVSALVLDSVEPTDGPDPFSLATLAAMDPVLAELCSEDACRGITSTPLADIAHLAQILHSHPLRAAVYDGAGHRHVLRTSEGDLLGVLQAGDLNPALRALLPAAVRSALRGDASPLVRLTLLAEGLIPTLPVPPKEGEGIDTALNATTICEEAPFPWGRGEEPAARQSEAAAALRALPSSAFYPFDANLALESGTIPGCLDWPDAAPAPAPVGPPPNVPTLILSGAQDLRTPTSGARRVAATIPDAQLLVVPYTGHSVLGTDFTDCASLAIKAFFSNAPVQVCAPASNIFTPTPITPAHLESVSPAAGVPGRAGRTVTAVLDTILDLNRQVIGATLQANQSLPSGSSFGGLRGGYARLRRGSVLLHRLSFVPGVQLSGIFPVKEGRLQATTVQVSGSAAAAGTVRVGSGKRVSGDLGGRRFNVALSKVKLSRVGGAWPSAPVSFPSPGLAQLR